MYIVVRLASLLVIRRPPSFAAASSPSTQILCCVVVVAWRVVTIHNFKCKRYCLRVHPRLYMHAALDSAALNRDMSNHPGADEGRQQKTKIKMVCTIFYIDPSFFFFFRFLVFSFSCRAKKLTIARIRAKHFARGPPTSVTMVYVHNMYKIKSSATATALLSRWVRSYNAAVAVAGRVYSV
jgi:hypothetical protein